MGKDTKCELLNSFFYLSLQQIIAMRFQQSVSIQWVAEFIDAQLIGKQEGEAKGLNEIHKVQPGDITFVDFEKYYQKSLQSAATFIIIDKEVVVPAGKSILVCPAPFDAYVRLVKYFRAFEPANQLISETAEIGIGTHIQPGVFIGNHVKIGKNCLIHSNVSIYDYTEIGDNVIIHAQSVIGADAFYYKRKKEASVQYDKMESCGRVVIEDSVEIGASCTIDKGVSGDTIIGKGTKLDNQVHVGHGVEIGKNCLIAAQVGIAGKTIIEDEVILWGQVGVNKDLRIGKGAVVYAQSGVPSSIEGAKVYFGSPVEEARTKMKEMAWSKRLPEIWQKLHAIENANKKSRNE